MNTKTVIITTAVVIGSAVMSISGASAGTIFKQHITDINGFGDRISKTRFVATDDFGDRTVGFNARMGLARFLVGSELNYEGIGVLNLLFRQR